MKIAASHDEVKQAFSDGYNKLYLQNRLEEKRPRTDEEWQFLVDQADDLAKRSKFERLVVNLILKIFETGEEVVSHEETKQAFSDAYNKFYLKNRLSEKRLRTDEEWEFLVEQADNYAKRSSLLRNLVVAILSVFESDEEKIRKGSTD